MKRVFGSVAVALALVGVASPASADPPAGSARTCPPPFAPFTATELLALAQDVGVSEQRATALFTRINKNGDRWICVRDLPGDDPESFGFVDNQAIGRR